MDTPSPGTLEVQASHRRFTFGDTEALQTELNETFEPPRGNLKALKVKLNLLLVMVMAMLSAVLALLWKTFFSAP